MIQKNEVLLKQNDEWLYFTNPHQIISVTNVDGVHHALQEIEHETEANNWHAAGFISYEAAPAFDNALRVLSVGDFPLLWFGLYPKPHTLQASEVYFDKLKSRPNQKQFQNLVTHKSYNTAIEKIKDYIAQGKTYQVNYTMRLNAEFSGAEWDFFLSLAQTQNKYAAYIDIGHHVICSASPELFFKLDGNKIYSRPMKGTAKRGRTTLEDKKQAEWLQTSIKNRAENVMIVDMVRNDLGRIAEIGSVQAPELFTIEKYPTLFQMTSTIQAKTNASIDEIFSALFPCASITGAPKISAMNIIAELETEPRKLYTGAIGYIAPNRKAQFSVAIRTALIDRENESIEYGVGGGIVWDSVSMDEYNEALLKSRVLTEHPRDFSLIETLLWTAEDGYFLREKHIERMCDSAEYFDFTYSKKILENYLEELAKSFKSARRVRIVLDQNGNLSAEDKPHQANASNFTANLANTPIDSKNIFLFHKTTHREVYESAKTAQNYDDVLLYNERGELTEFTIGNLVVEINGGLYTPPISCGVLAGTYRAHLLETGKINERIIHKDELIHCSKIFLINSVRKWVEVKI